MTVADIINDPFLLSVLETSAATRAECLSLLDEASSSHPTGINPDNNGAPPSPPGSSLTLFQKQQLLFSALSRLRNLNREAVLGVRETKQVTAEARQEIDRLHLQLQNLYYEQRHLNGEIAACEAFDHKYSTLPLIPLEEFLTLFPDLTPQDPSNPTAEEEDALMRARISHEHSEREKLEQARQELLKRKQALIAENKKRKEDLADLDKDLERFIDAAGPIRKTFEREY